MLQGTGRDPPHPGPPSGLRDRSLRRDRFLLGSKTDGEPIFPSGCNAAEQEGIDSRCEVSDWLGFDLRRNPAPNARGA